MVLQKTRLEVQIKEGNERMRDTLEFTSRNLTAQVEKGSKDLERLKYDLHELVEQKTDAMHRMFETELMGVRKRYQEACQGVLDAKDSINAAFRKKVRTIKEKSAIFFAKLEMKLEENNKETVAVSKMFREW